MSRRRTYTERRAYSARVMRFREQIYREREPVEMLDRQTGEVVTFALTNGCRLLLLRLCDDMDQNGRVSVSRSTLSEHLGVAPARITEWVRVAHHLGLLTTVRRGRPGVTAVYQGLIANEDEVRKGVPSQRYARADQAEVRGGVPPESSTWYALGTTQENVQTARTETVPESRGRDVSNDEKHEPPQAAALTNGCRWHPHMACPEDCENAPTTRRAEM